MQQVTQNKDRTIIFVSHNMGVISQLCHRVILIDKGKIVKIGKPEEVISYYLDSGIRAKALTQYDKDLTKKIQIRQIKVMGHENKPSVELDLCKPFSIEIEYDVNESVNEVVLESSVIGLDGSVILTSTDCEEQENYERLYIKKREIGKYVARLSYPKNLFNAGTYRLDFHATSVHDKTHYDAVLNVNVSFYDSENFYQKYKADRAGLITVPVPWETQKV